MLPICARTSDLHLGEMYGVSEAQLVLELTNLTAGIRSCCRVQSVSLMRLPKLLDFVVALGVSLGSQACNDFGTEPAGSHIPELKGFCYTSFASTGFTLGGRVNAVGDLKTQINNDWIALSIVNY